MASARMCGPLCKHPPLSHPTPCHPHTPALPVCRPAPPPSTRAPRAPTPSSVSPSRRQVRCTAAALHGCKAACVLLARVWECSAQAWVLIWVLMLLTTPHRCPVLPAPSADRADALTDPNARLGRTISYLNLIDLAGSESAKVRSSASDLSVSCSPSATHTWRHRLTFLCLRAFDRCPMAPSPPDPRRRRR